MNDDQIQICSTLMRTRSGRNQHHENHQHLTPLFRHTSCILDNGGRGACHRRGSLTRLFREVLSLITVARRRFLGSRSSLRSEGFSGLNRSFIRCHLAVSTTKLGIHIKLWRLIFGCLRPRFLRFSHLPSMRILDRFNWRPAGFPCAGRSAPRLR